jgi:hypothetical protein
MIVREGEEEEMVGVGHKMSVLLRPLGKSVAEASSNGGGYLRTTSELVQSLRALTVWALARHINPPSPHGKHERTRKLYHRP